MVEEKKKNRYEFVEVPTQMGIVIKDNETEKMFSTDDAILEILNKINGIAKVVGDK